MRFFRKKAYGLTAIFVQRRIIIYHAKMRKKCLEKKRKKKVLKTKKLSIFSISPKYSGEMESIRFKLFDKI